MTCLLYISKKTREKQNLCIVSQLNQDFVSHMSITPLKIFYCEIQQWTIERVNQKN